MNLKKIISTGLLFMFISFFFTPSAAQCDRERDSLVLVEMYSRNPLMRQNVNWVVNGLPLDQWTGITTNTQGCITKIVFNKGSGITSLPNSLGSLSELNRLFILSNGIKIIPESIGDLKNLEFLSVNFNRIDHLPESMAGLSNLRFLGLSGNKINEFPDWIGDLPRLEHLELGNSRLTAVPDWIRNLDRLNLLLIGFNYVEEFPSWIAELKQLRVITLFYNKIADIPEELSDLPMLSSLNLSYNQLTAVPDWMQNMEQLRYLGLSGNNLTEVPSWIGNFTNLNTFYLSDNQLTILPESMANLTNMGGLRLNGNQLTEIPDWIGNFTGMSQLWLHNNEFKEIPPSIDNLTNLDWLAIDGNRFTFSHVQEVNNALPALPRLNYAPQKEIYKDTILYFQTGSAGRISLGIDENIPDNQYRWRKDEVNYSPAPGNDINSNELIIPDIGLDDVGNYIATVVNPRFPELTLESYPVRIRVCDRENDSLELVRLYNSTNGTSWDKQDGWLTTAPIEQWYGITTDPMGCVNKIDLSGNNLTGSLPGLDLNTLDTLIVRDNSLSGGIPNDLNTPYIKYADLASNSFAGALPPVLTEWMQLTNLDVSDNFLRESIPPEIGDLCELEQLEMDGNSFEGNIPTELTQLFNLKKGQVNFANNEIRNMEQEWIYFCPFGVEIMANNPGGFERFVTICGDTCTGLEYASLSDFPSLIEAIQELDCSGEACYEKMVNSDAGFVEVRGVTVAYTRTRCFVNETVYDETIKFYDCGGYLLDIYNCRSDEFCPGIAVLSPEEFASLQFDSRWSCLCNGVTCIARDTVAMDAGEVDTLFSEEYVLASDNCTPGLYGISSLNNELPGEPPYVTEDNIGFSYTLINENLISGQQCTTTIEVVRGSTSRNEYEKTDLDGPVMIVCHPNPVVDFLRCPEIDMVNVEAYKVFNIQGMEMPKYVQNYKDKLELDVENYPAGMYFLLVKTKDRQYLNRFAVIR